MYIDWCAVGTRGLARASAGVLVAIAFLLLALFIFILPCPKAQNYHLRKPQMRNHPSPCTNTGDCVALIQTIGRSVLTMKIVNVYSLLSIYQMHVSINLMLAAIPFYR